jgi:hypothetical protein
MILDFEPQEQAEYAKLESDALEFYRAFDHEQYYENIYYLKLMQRLRLLRIACAGGRIPLPAENKDKDEAVANASAKAKQKKVQKFSNFRFQSKFNVLIEELKRIHDVEPGCKCRSQQGLILAL